ncbi:MAG: hypothetical protein PHU01_03130 [Desulfuromonadaceae bacterium]|nr:hypothetical protein [Desulfuromonadaceae bacterium]
MLSDIWGVLLITGLIGWLFSSIMLMLKAFPQKDLFLPSVAAKWGAAAAVSYFIWIAGMLNA